jgi:hypothetical protein
MIQTTPAPTNDPTMQSAAYSRRCSSAGLSMMGARHHCVLVDQSRVAGTGSKDRDAMMAPFQILIHVRNSTQEGWEAPGQGRLIHRSSRNLLLGRRLGFE